MAGIRGMPDRAIRHREVPRRTNRPVATHYRRLRGLDLSAGAHLPLIERAGGVARVVRLAAFCASLLREGVAATGGPR